MSEFNIRSDSVDVEKLMEQIRARVRDKRGADYTEDQIRELAGVKLERFFDPNDVRSDLLQHYRQRGDRSPVHITRREPPPVTPSYKVDADIIYRSSRGAAGRLLYGIRRLLNPILKLFFNPGPMLHALTVQYEQIDWMVETHVELIERFETIAAKMAGRAELDALTYEVLNNLVVEMTRLSIDMKNHKMRVESIAARLDFDERRARALEDVVQYRSRGTSSDAASTDRPAVTDTAGTDGTAPEKRKRRRRRGRRRPTGVAATPEEADAPPGGDDRPAAEAAPQDASVSASAPAADPAPEATAHTEHDAAPRTEASDSTEHTRDPRADESRQPIGGGTGNTPEQ